MFGTIILLLIILLLLLGVVFFFTPPSNKKPPQTNWTTEQRDDNERWFSPHRWITDKEIDWACKRLPNTPKIKIFPAHQFHLVREAKKWNKEEELFTYLLSELTSETELVFIPVNKGNCHWSLLVYEGKSRKFYHYDSLGGMNDRYVEPLVKELLSHILPNTDFSKYLVHKHDIRQNNGYDCGIAVIEIIRRIIKLSTQQTWKDKLKYGTFHLGDDLGGFDFKKEREEYLKENK